MSYHCANCGELHEGLPDIGIDKPEQWWGVPEDERDERIELSSDTCVIDNNEFFIRGLIEIPIHDDHKSFGFGVWVSLKRENFEAYLNDYDSAELGPFFGWLCSRISYYNEDALLLKTMVHFRGGGLRPRVELEPTDHPLAIDQRNGIAIEEAWGIVHYYLNSSGE